MAAPKGNKFAKGNKGGNPGYGQMDFIKTNVTKYSKLWWKEWEQMMKSRPDEFINDNVRELVKALIKKGDGYTAKEIIKDLAKGAFYRKQFAMAEFNKLQAKLIPTQLTGEDGGDIKMSISWQNNISQSLTLPANGRKTSTKQPSAG